MSDTMFKRARDLPTAHLLGAGTAMCAGCGGLGAVREVYDVLGENTVFVNAAGCMTMLSVYPFTPFRVPGCIPPWPRRRRVHRVCATPSISVWPRVKSKPLTT